MTFPEFWHNFKSFSDLFPLNLSFIYIIVVMVVVVFIGAEGVGFILV